ncbi:MAG: TIGR01777 family oxidoreductase [Chitinophagaceae bacterium]
MATILITGGTGLIGKALTKALLEKNYKVVVLSRGINSQQTETTNLSFAQWDINSQQIDKAAVESADYIIHLAGAGVADKRWTTKRKKEIVDSRVKGSELIVKALQEIPNNIKAVISASAIGWYGADPVIPNPKPFREDDPNDNDFLGETCKLWEESLQPIGKMGKRLIKLRTGIVLSNEGGALKEFKNPLRFGVATILGNGKQIISWIHIDDLVRLYMAAIKDQNMNGVYNAVAPAPVSNKGLTLQIARVQKGNFFIPVHVPSFVLKMVLGEMSIEVLKSATVSCDKVHYGGFIFLYPGIEAALANLKQTLQ